MKSGKLGFEDIGMLALRAATGGLLAGHGAQKLFGWFEGPGPEGTRGMVQMMGLKPHQPWAILAGASEFGGGVLTALGFLNPVGSIAALGSMGMATMTVHSGKPIWVTSGGAELPVTNIAVATAIALAGPGKLSIDHALGIHIPKWAFFPGAAMAMAGVAVGLATREQNPQGQDQDQAREEGA